MISPKFPTSMMARCRARMSGRITCQNLNLVFLHTSEQPPHQPQSLTNVVTLVTILSALGSRLFPLFALALDLPENFFDDKTTKPAAIMRLLYYPPQPPCEVDDRVLGIGAHTE